jgi:hypothetical protein
VSIPTDLTVYLNAPLSFISIATSQTIGTPMNLQAFHSTYPIKQHTNPYIYYISARKPRFHLHFIKNTHPVVSENIFIFFFVDYCYCELML